MGFPGSKHAKCFRDGICQFSSQRCICCKFIFLFKYYGRSTGREHKDFSKEECVERWEIAKIFERSWYCYHRWYSQAQLTFKLRFIYYASRLHLQLCSTKEQEQAHIEARRMKKLLIDGIPLPFPEDLANWSAGSQHFPDMTIQWLTLKHTWRKTMIENPWILIQNDFLRSRVFKMIWAHFNAFVHLEILPVKPSGPILELQVWNFAGPKSYVGFSPNKPVWSLITYFSGNLRSLLHPNTAQRSPFAIFYLCQAYFRRNIWDDRNKTRLNRVTQTRFHWFAPSASHNNIYN